MAMFMMIIMISILIIGTARIDARNIKDDDCMDIAMRPLPRFGKRSSDLNRGMQQQPQQQQLSSSSLLRRFPAWKHLLDQLAAQKEKMIIDHLLNIRLNPTLSINQQQTQQNNNPDTLEQQQSSIEQQQQQQKQQQQQQQEFEWENFPFTFNNYPNFRLNRKISFQQP
ncbi:hypothetical protein DERF_016051 [Dermatophagoides farinae]|uniref:Uncharacterized protein n=1 Tax=Dermatophagoides farinae TaxID=6954 RepID=A0A922HL38_DERFA|nr:hypothetical protein DERF_016051 [Dermatophagoides farinae]